MLLADPPTSSLLTATVSPSARPAFSRSLARHHWHLLPEAGRHAVLLAECYADGLADDSALADAWDDADIAVRCIADERLQTIAETAAAGATSFLEPAEVFCGSFRRTIPDPSETRGFLARLAMLSKDLLDGPVMSRVLKTEGLLAIEAWRADRQPVYL